MSLQYNVATQLREPVGATREYAIEGRLTLDGEARSVRGAARFLRTKHGILVTAQVSGTERLPCSRCLRETEEPVKAQLEEEFFATVDAVTGARLPRPEDPEAFVIDDRQTLDLEEPLRQSWMLDLPMQPLCRPDCRGLCPRCGADLNLGPCECAPGVDERWSALGALKEGT